MSTTFRDVTNAELAVLQVLWERGRATIRQISDELYPQGRASDYATVQKLLERLEGKGCVDRDRAGPAHVFWAAIGRDELIGHRLRNMAEKICDGSLTPLLTNLVQHERLTPEERMALRAMLESDEAEGGE